MVKRKRCPNCANRTHCSMFGGTGSYLGSAADAVDDDSLALERDHTALVAVIETQAQHHALGAELILSAIEEDVLLQMGDLVRRR